MHLCKYEGPIKPFMIGRPLAGFSIDSIDIQGERAIARGQLSFKDATAGLKNIQPTTSIDWQAENSSDGSIFTGWKVFQQAAKAQPMSSAVTEGFRTFVKAELNLLVEKQPGVLAVKSSRDRSSGNNGSAAPHATAEAPKNVEDCFAPGWAQGWRPAPPNKKYPRRPKATPQPEPVPEPEPIVAESAVKPARAVELYDGPRAPYGGDCVCTELDESNGRQPFDWASMTRSLFPKRCFECSCGARWWCSRPKEHFWVRVADLRAWGILCDHNGIPAGTFAYEGEKLYLLDTLVRDGNILPYYLHKE